jgi:predicted ribosomally synthesized peptide with nif11-like leader
VLTEVKVGANLEGFTLLRAMSEEQLKAFLEAVKADSSLQEQLKAAGDADAVVAIAKAAGFPISADDLKKAQAKLTDKELEGVAGAGMSAAEICQEALLAADSLGNVGAEFLCSFGGGGGLGPLGGVGVGSLDDL